MARTPQELPSFKSDLRTLISDIRTGAYETYQYEMDSMDGGVADPNRNPYRLNIALFDSLMATLELELEDYIDGNYTRLDQALGFLEEVSDLLSRVEGNDGLTTVLVTLGNESWDSDAASAMRITVEQLKEIAVLQGLYVAELGRAVGCLRRILTHARADVFDLAEQAKKKLTGSSGFGIDLGDVLWITGAIIAGVATSGAAAWAGWAIANARVVWSKLDAMGEEEEGPVQARKIIGYDHFEILGSALDELYNLRNEISGQEADLTGALREDIAEVQAADASPAKKGINITRQRYNDDDLTEFGHDYTATKLADLYVAGTHQLPYVAWLYDQMVIKLGLVRSYATMGFGNQQVLRSSYATWDAALQELETAVVNSRDAIFEIAEDLVIVANNYAEADQVGEEMMESAQGELDRYAEIGEPVYRGEDRRRASDWESATGEEVRPGGYL